MSAPPVIVNNTKQCKCNSLENIQFLSTNLCPTCKLSISPERIAEYIRARYPLTVLTLGEYITSDSFDKLRLVPLVDNATSYNHDVQSIELTDINDYSHPWRDSEYKYLMENIGTFYDYQNFSITEEIQTCVMAYVASKIEYIITVISPDGNTGYNGEHRLCKYNIVKLQNVPDVHYNIYLENCNTTHLNGRNWYYVLCDLSTNVCDDLLWWQPSLTLEPDCGEEPHHREKLEYIDNLKYTAVQTVNDIKTQLARSDMTTIQSVARCLAIIGDIVVQSGK